MEEMAKKAFQKVKRDIADLKKEISILQNLLKRNGESLDIQEDFKKKAIKLANELKNSYPEISGISIAGSLANGSADKYSDIDLDIWLPEKIYKKWFVSCPLMSFFKKYSIKRETPTNFSFGVEDSHKFDMTLLSVERIRKGEWTVEQKSDRKNSIIIFDRNNIIKDTLNQKLKIKRDIFDTKEKYSILNPNPEYYIFYISAYLNYHVPVAIARKKFEQAHFIINQAIHFLLNLLWLENENFYPYDKTKWIITDKYLNEEQKKLFRESQLIKNYTEDDVKRRRKLLRELYSKLGYKEIKFYHEKVDLS